MTEREWVIAKVACPTCNAAPGGRCYLRHRNGVPARSDHIHSTRFALAFSTLERPHPVGVMRGLGVMHAPAPWPGGAAREFTRADVVAIGKVRVYGDFVTRYLVRLADGAELFVNGAELVQEDARWLAKLGRGFTSGLPSREAGWSLRWKELP